jgi:hypothetical protein
MRDKRMEDEFIDAQRRIDEARIPFQS